MSEAAEVERRRANAAGLRQAARALLSATGLLELLAAQVGPPILVGSVALDLMVWPDIDIHMPLAHAERERMIGLAPRLLPRFEAAGLAVRELHYLDDHVEPHPLGAGLYCGVRLVERATRRKWKCDIWGWDPQDHARRQQEWRGLVEALAGADRDLILRLKEEAREKPGCYGQAVTSIDLYRFAIARAGTTLEELEAFARASR